MSRAENFLTGAHMMDDYSDTSYTYGTGENALGTQSGATLRVRKPKTNYQDPINFTSDYKQDTTGHYERDDEGNYIKKDWLETTGTRPGEQIPLFEVKHRPPILEYMVATKDSLLQAQSLAAHAVEETRRRFGERPLASSSTSEHSTPLVNKAIEDGLIKGVEGQAAGTAATQGNRYNFWDSLQGMHEIQQSAERINAALNSDDGFDPRSDSTFSKIPEEKMQFDKTALAKEALANRRARKPKAPTPNNFEQLALPEAPFGHK